jgi:hypothetical protein
VSDLAEQEPDFAIGAGPLALHWLARGFGYEMTGVDVWAAYSSAIAAAEQKRTVSELGERIRQIISTETAGGFVSNVLRSQFST